MCGPMAVPIIMAVVAAGTAVYESNVQKHNLEDQMKLQMKQTDQAAAAQTNDRLKAAREQRAAARAAAAQVGASGHSADAIMTDLMMQSGRDVSRIEKNRENGQLQNQQEAKATSAEINSQLIRGLSSAASSAASASSSSSSSH